MNWLGHEDGGFEVQDKGKRSVISPGGQTTG